mgnify:CR=1 FL=1
MSWPDVRFVFRTAVIATAVLLLAWCLVMNLFVRVAPVGPDLSRTSKALEAYDQQDAAIDKLMREGLKDPSPVNKKSLARAYLPMTAALHRLAIEVSEAYALDTADRAKSRDYDKSFVRRMVEEWRRRQ